MSRNDKSHDERFDDALEAIRSESPDSQEARAAIGRVWERLDAERASGANAPAAEASVPQAIRDCAGFQSHLPALVAGELDEARKLLVKDHLRDCFECSRALRAVKARAQGSGAAANDTARHSGRRMRTMRYIGSAAAALAVVAVGLFATQSRLPAPLMADAGIPFVSGTLFKVGDESSESLAGGATVAAGERVRTGKGSGAVIELADGSRVALNERSEVSFVSGWRDTTIELERGSIIVEASQRGSGHLYVKTDDCRVAVTGTVFSVTNAMSGSRVSVFEGEVHVDQAQERAVLTAGDQLTTHPSVASVSLDHDIAWSREYDLDEHLQLVRELVDLGRALDEVPEPKLRRTSELLDVVPEETVVFVAVPNMAQTVTDGFDIVRTQVDESPLLSEWWQKNVTDMGVEAEIETMVEKLRSYGDLLGDEMVFAFAPGRDIQVGDVAPPVAVLATLDDADAFAALLERDLAEVGVDLGAGELPNVVRGRLDAAAVAKSAAPSGELTLWLGDEILVATPHRETLSKIAAARTRKDGGGFGTDTLRDRIADRYESGAGWVVAIDVERVLASTAEERMTDEGFDPLALFGIDNAQHLILERKSFDDMSMNQAVLYFDGPRQGLASWITGPSPLGALEFVSPGAHLASAFVVEEPSRLLDELFDTLERLQPDFAEQRGQIEAEQGFRFVEDLAASLGGEFAFALDGPVLPEPAWKAIVEVYDEKRLQRTIESMVERLNEELSRADQPQVTLEKRTIAGRDSHVLTIPGSPVVPSYTYWDGYLIAAPEPALLEQAIEHRASGLNLANAESLRELLPPRGPDHVSAIVYQQLGPVLSPLFETVGAATAGLAPEQAKMLKELSADAGASLLYAYGEDDRLVVAGSGKGGLGNELGRLLGTMGLLGMQQSALTPVGTTGGLTEPEEPAVY